MPKGGKFKYEITKGKPWQYENLYAPFDFAILKTDDEIVKEKDQIIDNHIPYFNYNEELADKIKENAQVQISEFFNDSILNRRQRAISDFVSKALDNIYETGVLQENARIEDDQLVYLKKEILPRNLPMAKYFLRKKSRNI